MRKLSYRLFISALVLLLVSILLFALIHLQKGNPYSNMMDPNTSPELYKDMLTKLGYYDPLPIKYGKWLSRFLRGDMGHSIVSGKPVLEMILDRLPQTLLLTASSLLLTLIICIPLGIWTAYHELKWQDILVSSQALIIISLPTFLLGLLLIKLFSFDLKWLPTSGIRSLKENYEGWDHVKDVFVHLILPMVTLSLTQFNYFQRHIRNIFIEILHSEYILAAMAKGMTKREAIIRHGMKNAIIPFLTILFLELPTLFSGALITETIFNWPGIGRMTFDAVQRRDYLVIIGVLMISAILIVMSNLLADLSYMWLDKNFKRTE